MEESPGTFLSQKERKALKKQHEQERIKKEMNKRKLIRWGVIVVVISIVGFLGWCVVKESTKPLPGKVVEDLGRQHISKKEWETFTYNSNPPTSGPHDADWIRPGVYDQPQGDGYLVHSLEHGYVIISYSCMKLHSKHKTLPRRQASQNSKLSLVGFAYAHGTEEEHALEGSTSGQLTSETWKSKECEALKKQLKDLATEQKLWKLIVVPRSNLDVPIALTAWTRIEKLNSFDKNRIFRFINAFRNKGPEQTME